MIRSEQRQQSRLQPAMREMSWSPAVATPSVNTGTVIDISRSGLCFAIPTNTTPPDVGQQIVVQFKTQTLRPLVYTVVRRSLRAGDTLLGCSRQLRYETPASPKRMKDLSAVRAARGKRRDASNN